MKQITQILVLVLLIGCVTTGDPLVVNAERVTRSAFEAFDAFLKLEYDNRPFLAKWPKIRQSADFIGDHGPKLLTNTTHQIQLYKQSRSYADKGVLESSVGGLKGMSVLALDSTAESLGHLSTNKSTKVNP